jgi:tRNA threonylcarbamoyladenosine biosynthesis protein TsaE
MTEYRITFISQHVDETREVGARIGQLLQAGDVVCLQGDLGSGKTSLTQGIGLGMGVSDTINSPTFVFIREHRPSVGTLRLVHVDLYRVEKASEALALGLTDYIDGDDVTIIEWAERAAVLMPQECIWVDFTILADTQRKLIFRANGARYVALLKKLQLELSAHSDTFAQQVETTSCC